MLRQTNNIPELVLDASDQLLTVNDDSVFSVELRKKPFPYHIPGKFIPHYLLSPRSMESVATESRHEGGDKDNEQTTESETIDDYSPLDTSRSAKESVVLTNAEIQVEPARENVLSSYEGDEDSPFQVSPSGTLKSVTSTQTVNFSRMRNTEIILDENYVNKHHRHACLLSQSDSHRRLSREDIQDAETQISSKKAHHSCRQQSSHGSPTSTLTLEGPESLLCRVSLSLSTDSDSQFSRRSSLKTPTNEEGIDKGISTKTKSFSDIESLSTADKKYVPANLNFSPERSNSLRVSFDDGYPTSINSRVTQQEALYDEDRLDKHKCRRKLKYQKSKLLQTDEEDINRMQQTKSNSKRKDLMSSLRSKPPFGNYPSPTIAKGIYHSTEYQSGHHLKNKTYKSSFQKATAGFRNDLQGSGNLPFSIKPKPKEVSVNSQSSRTRHRSGCNHCHTTNSQIVHLLPTSGCVFCSNQLVPYAHKHWCSICKQFHSLRVPLLAMNSGRWPSHGWPMVHRFSYGSSSRQSQNASRLSLDRDIQEEKEHLNEKFRPSSAMKIHRSKRNSRPLSASFQDPDTQVLHPCYVQRPKSALASSSDEMGRASPTMKHPTWAWHSKEEPSMKVKNEDLFLRSSETQTTQQASETSSPFEASLNFESVRNAELSKLSDEEDHGGDIPTSVKGFISSSSTLVKRNSELNDSPQSSPAQSKNSIKEAASKTTSSPKFLDEHESPQVNYLTSPDPRQNIIMTADESVNINELEDNLSRTSVLPTQKSTSDKDVCDVSSLKVNVNDSPKSILDTEIGHQMSLIIEEINDSPEVIESLKSEMSQNATPPVKELQDSPPLVKSTDDRNSPEIFQNMSPSIEVVSNTANIDVLNEPPDVLVQTYNTCEPLSSLVVDSSGNDLSETLSPSLARINKTGMSIESNDTPPLSPSVCAIHSERHSTKEVLLENPTVLTSTTFAHEINEPLQMANEDDVNSPSIVLTAHGFNGSPHSVGKSETIPSRISQKNVISCTPGLCPTCRQRLWTSEMDMAIQRHSKRDPVYEQYERVNKSVLAQTIHKTQSKVTEDALKGSHTTLRKSVKSIEELLQQVPFSSPSVPRRSHSRQDLHACPTCEKLGLKTLLSNEAGIEEKLRLSHEIWASCYQASQPLSSSHPLYELNSRSRSAIPWCTELDSGRRNIEKITQQNRPSLPWCRPRSSIGEAVRSKRYERHYAVTSSTNKQSATKEVPDEGNTKNDNSKKPAQPSVDQFDLPSSKEPLFKRQLTPIAQKANLQNKKKKQVDPGLKDFFPQKLDTIDSGIPSFGESVHDSLRFSQYLGSSKSDQVDLGALFELKNKFPTLQRELEQSRHQIVRWKEYIQSLEEENEWLKHRVDEYEADMRRKEQQMDQLTQQIRMLEERPICGVPCQRDRALLKQLLSDFEKINHEYQALTTEYQILERRLMEAKQEVQMECHRSHRLQMEIDRLMCEQTALRDQIRMHEWREKEMIEREALLRKALDCTSPGYNFMSSWRHSSISRKDTKEHHRSYHNSDKYKKESSNRLKRGDSEASDSRPSMSEGKKHSKSETTRRRRDSSRDRVSPVSHSPYRGRNEEKEDLKFNVDDEREMTTMELRSEKARLEDILYNDVPAGSSGKVRYLTPSQRADMEAQLAFIEARMKMNRGRRK